MTAAQRRAHHAKQRARKQLYRAWESENGSMLDALGIRGKARKTMYHLRNLAAPIVRCCYEPGMLRDLIQVGVQHARDAFVSTASAEVLPKLAEMVGATEEKP